MPELAISRPIEALIRALETFDEKDLSNEELAALMAVAPAFSQVAYGITGEAERRAFRGEHIPGHKVVAGRMGARKWTDEEGVVGVCEKLDVDPYARRLRTPTDINKELGAHFANHFSNFVVQDEGKPKLVPESDKRPARDPNQQARMEFGIPDHIDQ